MQLFHIGNDPRSYASELFWVQAVVNRYKVAQEVLMNIMVMFYDRLFSIHMQPRPVQIDDKGIQCPSTTPAQEV